MNISENKRVVGLSALFAIAFAGVAYYGYSEMSRFDAAKKQLNTINEQFLDYEAAKVPPTKKNKEALSASFKQVCSVSDEMKAKLKAYVAFCKGDGKLINGTGMQEELRNAVAQVGQLAKEKNVNLAGTAADLGMSSILRAFPEDAHAPYYAFQHRAVRRVVEDLINAGAPSVERVYCAPLPEAVTDGAKKKNKAQAYVPLRFEVYFEAERGVLPRVINSIVNDKDFFLTITGIAVDGDDRVAPIDEYSAPAAAPAGGDDLTADAPAADDGSARRRIAVRKTGDPHEKARVNLNLQVLYFTSDNI